MTEEKVDALSLTDDEDNEDSDYEPALPELKGVLNKWTNYLHGWQNRYIVLKEGTLSYYKSENDTAFGCRGAVSLAKASVSPHQFDECRFDINVNDCVWYLRADSEDDRQHWINAIELHRVFFNTEVPLVKKSQLDSITQAESGYGSENNLRRHGSMISLTSGTSLSTTSTSSFKRGRGLREKLAEMETFRDILCRQIDTLQSYFDSCASAVSDGPLQELHDDIGDPDDLHDSAPSSDHPNVPFAGPSGKDLECILKQHGGHAVDFKGESFTFKATTAGIIATLSHCMELMSQREEAWRKRLEKEVERRKKFEEAYKTAVSDHKQTTVVIGGPDFEEGPHCHMKDDEFYDAVDASLDILNEKIEEENELRKKSKEATKESPKISLSANHPLYAEINKITSEHLKRMDEKQDDGVDTWQVIAEDGDLKVYKRELEVDGVVIDPLKACHVVKGITGHEVCQHFWDIDVRMEWDLTLESSIAAEVFSEDTIVSHNVIKRVWPASQRDALFWSHIRHVVGDSDEIPDRWIVVNYSTEHPRVPSNKYVRVMMNVAMICETIIEPPTDGGEITRNNIKCKISYTADVNPGGWAPASVLRAVYKREYPRFLKRFTSYVFEKTKEKAILF